VRIRRLGAGDAALVRSLATQGEPERVVDLLADERTIFLVAFADEEPVGFLLAYELIRRHGDASQLFVYELQVDPEHRRRGIATAMVGEPRAVAQGRGIRSGFLLTNESNAEAMALYHALGGRRPAAERRRRPLGLRFQRARRGRRTRLRDSPSDVSGADRRWVSLQELRSPRRPKLAGSDVSEGLSLLHVLPCLRAVAGYRWLP
jgi:ribosomal protein S18 acetylase RimI-like enzyme